MAENGILTIKTFKEIYEKELITPPTLDTVNKLNLNYLTKCQLQSLPVLLKKSNAYIKAKTGSGKTLAFLIPSIERLNAMKFKDEYGTGLLVLSPTRELSMQSADVAQKLCDAHSLKCSLIIGGKKRIEDISNTSVLIATLGVLVSVIQKERSNTWFNANKLKILVLDEADRLLDGSSHTELLKKILKYISLDGVQVILVSATISDKSMALAESLFSTKFEIITQVNVKTETPNHIDQHYVIVKQEEKLAMLITTLSSLKKKKVIVFFSSCNSVKFHQKILAKFGLPVIFCTGKNNQSKRSSSFKEFNNSSGLIFLTTGLAERGWDIKNIDWVIQYDSPNRPEDYVHRIGRTGRGENLKGKALLFLYIHEEDFIKYLSKYHISATELDFSGDLKGINEQVKSYVDSDISLAESSTRAYKSSVRAYQSYKLKKIFNLKKIDQSLYCHSFGHNKPPLQLGKLN